MKKYSSIIFLLCIVGFTYNGKAQESQTDTVKSSKIEFTEIVHDFGTIENGGNGMYEFKFQNIGPSPVTLENVRSSCGCTIPIWPKEAILPGAEALIKVKYDTKRTGAFTKTITVYANAKGSPFILKITGVVKPKDES